MSAVRNEVAGFVINQRKGATFTTEDLYNNTALYSAAEVKTARNRLAEFAAAGLLQRITRGTYKVTSSVQTRKSRLS